MRNKTLIKKLFLTNNKQETLVENFIFELIKHNKHTNLVGKSTLIDPWRSHILDSCQISPFIKKNSSILDMGTGAGFPGLILAMMGFKNVSLIDSNSKKINFIREVSKKLDIKANIYLKRIENLNNKKFDFLVSRALANLTKLLTYSHKFISKDSVLIFLKGKAVNEEIKHAQKKWRFDYSLKKSQSDERGKILIIKNLKTLK